MVKNYRGMLANLNASSMSQLTSEAISYKNIAEAIQDAASGGESWVFVESLTNDQIAILRSNGFKVDTSEDDDWEISW